MLISSLFLSKTRWCFSIRRLSLVTPCTIINPQFYTGHSCNFLRVENETMADFTRALESSLRFLVNAFAKENLNFLVHSKQSASLNLREG